MRLPSGPLHDHSRCYAIVIYSPRHAVAWLLMADATYQIIQLPDQTFAVEIVRVGALPQTAAGFDSEAAAQGWIAQDQRLWGATDMFATPAGRRWRDH